MCRAMPGASCISGLARMLATIRSNGAIGREGRMVEAGCGDRLDIGRRAVQAHILPGDAHRDRIDVGRKHRDVCQLGDGDGEHARCRCRGRARFAAARGAPRGRSFRGSRRWCRDGRCRRQGRPRSRWRCAPMWLSARSCAPCTKKRPARTGRNPSSERATQSISGSVSRSTMSSRSTARMMRRISASAWPSSSGADIERDLVDIAAPRRAR